MTIQWLVSVGIKFFGEGGEVLVEENGLGHWISKELVEEPNLGKVYL